MLISKGKTEQNTQALEYIPGSNIRGIVAGSLFSQNADKNDINNIIFNGSVLFGDAHLIINGQRSHKIPASYYYEKDNNTIINFPTTDDFKSKKLKQQRAGYFIFKKGKLNIAKPNYGDSIKSSRNIEKRSSRKGGLYVYHYLKKGQSFQFEILSDNDKLLEKVNKVLHKQTKFIGKAKGAEFGGKVKFSFSKAEDVTIIKTTGTILYADSNLCFLNEFGEFTARPTAKQLTGDDNAKIDWEKSHIRFRRYMPYNQFRQNWDAERLIIEKGSVFVFEKEVEFKNDLSKGIGCFVTEGYGRVLINPDFLNINSLNIVDITETSNDNQSHNNQKVSDKNYIKYLQQLNKEQELSETIQKKVNEYVEKKSFSKSISASQWSRVYNATKMITDNNSLENILEDIQKGKSKEIWKNKDKKLIDDFLSDEIITNNKVFALKLLSKKMRLETKNK